MLTHRERILAQILEERQAGSNPDPLDSTGRGVLLERRYLETIAEWRVCAIFVSPPDLLLCARVKLSGLWPPIFGWVQTSSGLDAEFAVVPLGYCSAKNAIIMDRFGSSLEKKLGGNLCSEYRVGIALRCVQCVQHVHEKGIVHRDIKASNFLVEGSIRNKALKLADFGLAVRQAGPFRDWTLYGHRELILSLWKHCGAGITV